MAAAWPAVSLDAPKDAVAGQLFPLAQFGETFLLCSFRGLLCLGKGEAALLCFFAGGILVAMLMY